MKINIKTMKLDTNIVNKTNTIYIHNIPFLTKKTKNSCNYYFFPVQPCYNQTKTN